MYSHMYSHRRVLPLILALGSTVLAADLPTEWIDAATGHRVIRLSREDGTQSLYFNQNAYTADGKKLIVTTAGGGIATIDLATREVKPLVAGPASVLVAGRRPGRRAQYQRGHRLRNQCEYGRHTRGGEAAAGAQRGFPECGRNFAARHLCGWCGATRTGGQPDAP